MRFILNSRHWTNTKTAGKDHCMTNKTRATQTKTTPTRQRPLQTGAQADAETPLHVDLAAEAVLEGWTREQVIDTLISRISRDRRYLAYRKACNRRTSYDDQVQQDMRALALAACWLAERASGVASGLELTSLEPSATSTPQAARRTKK